MAFIWQRKKNLIVALGLGVLVTAVPMGTIIAVESVSYKRCSDELQKINDNKDRMKKIKLFILNSDKRKGDLISENDLIESSIDSETDFNGAVLKSEIIGKELKIDADKGTIINSGMLYEQDKMADDVRMHIYSDIELHQGILEGNIVDIRIMFPNGEDYIVAEHKKIESRTENDILIMVNEEEILKLASAHVDKNLYEGAKLYAIKYVKDYQEAAKSDYPVNRDVIELGSWNPNLIEKVFNEDTANKRNILEANMNEFKA